MLKMKVIFTMIKTIHSIVIYYHKNIDITTHFNGIYTIFKGLKSLNFSLNEPTKIKLYL